MSKCPSRSLVTSGRGDAYTVRDLLTGERFEWHGRRNYIALDPAAAARARVPYRAIARDG